MNTETRIETVKHFFYGVKAPIRNFVDNAIGALFGNPVAFKKCLEAVSHSPFFIREQIFWTKLSMFLDGINLSDDERETLPPQIDLQPKTASDEEVMLDEIFHQGKGFLAKAANQSKNI